MSPPAKIWDGPGGEEWTDQRRDAAVLRADLVALVSQHSFRHASAIADSVLEHYGLTSKYPVWVDRKSDKKGTS